jgi:hypothetical protein
MDTILTIPGARIALSLCDVAITPVVRRQRPLGIVPPMSAGLRMRHLAPGQVCP